MPFSSVISTRPASSSRSKCPTTSEMPGKTSVAGNSEVVGHFDLLEDAGRVEITEENGIRLYDHR